ncbi:MAG: RnfABCDGE type electron transport complex subunit B [Bacillota bacterium]|nr:RnfABCDGE type electron transport complex subunit B [Bacillota bacterium]
MAANLIAVATISMGAVGAVLATGLAVASSVLKIETDPRVEQLLEALPGANCGACGYPGCQGLADALVRGAAPAGACVVGGAAVAARVAEILGVEVGEMPERRVARVLCGGDRAKAVDRAAYQGMPDCRAAGLVQGGPKGCSYGCLGFGNCEAACPFDALHLGDDGLPVVDEDKCTACGKCVAACPRGLMALLPAAGRTFVACSSRARGQEVRPVCKAGCIACGICVKTCPVKCITLEDNLARIDAALCTNCGLCVAKCPTKAIAGPLPVVQEAPAVAASAATVAASGPAAAEGAVVQG